MRRKLFFEAIMANCMQISGKVQYPNMKHGSGNISVLIILKESLLVSI